MPKDIFFPVGTSVGANALNMWPCNRCCKPDLHSRCGHNVLAFSIIAFVSSYC